jgi:hypothetical protein
VQRDEARAARDAFSALLLTDAPERAWQELFTRFPQVLADCLPGVKHLGLTLAPLGRPGRSEPDFVLYTSPEPDLPAFGVVELKRPQSRIVHVPRKNVLTLASDANTAVAQAREYSRQFDWVPVAHESQTLILGSGVHMFVVMGMSAELVRKLQNPALERQWDEGLPTGVTLVTYDELLDRLVREAPLRLHALGVLAQTVAGTSPLVVDYGRQGRVTRRKGHYPRPLLGVRTAGADDVVASIGVCPYCADTNGASALAPWIVSGIGQELQSFYSGTHSGLGFRLLACTSDAHNPAEFCEVYRLEEAAAWFRSLRVGQCGRCGSADVRESWHGSPPAWQVLTRRCSGCGLLEDEHRWGSMSSGA